jgi:hypothetical protein
VRALVLNALVTLLIVGGALWAYDRYRLVPVSRIGVIDVAETYRQKEAQFVASVTNRSADSSDPNLASEFATQFANQLTEALEALPEECKCLVLLKPAVVGRSMNIVDLTPGLRVKVGLPPQEAK